MTKEQFKKNFKVGDIITCSEWGESKTKIVYIGKYEFAGDDQGLNNGQEDGVDSHFMDARDWQLWEEPVEKDLEGLKKFYVLSERDDEPCLAIRYSTTKERIEEHNICDEVLTEEEAIERGLKI